jgi:putative transposase
MPKHVHLLAVPRHSESFARGLGMVHLDYTRHINRKYLRSGRVWQNRFFSCAVLTERHLWAVTRYIETNPVKACMTTSAEDYRWSSARHHLLAEPDPVIHPESWLKGSHLDGYRSFIRESDPVVDDRLRLATRRGQPLL